VRLQPLHIGPELDETIPNHEIEVAQSGLLAGSNVEYRIQGLRMSRGGCPNICEEVKMTPPDLPDGFPDIVKVSPMPG
jgi:hypothetical protein